MNEDDVGESTLVVLGVTEPVRKPTQPFPIYSMYLWATARGGAIMSLIVWGLLRRALAGKGPIGVHSANCG